MKTKKKSNPSGSSVLRKYLEGHKGPMSEKDYKELRDQNLALYMKKYINHKEYQKRAEELANMGYHEARKGGENAFFGAYPKK
jgi:hypothetical protein